MLTLSTYFLFKKVKQREASMATTNGKLLLTFATDKKTISGIEWLVYLLKLIRQKVVIIRRKLTIHSLLLILIYIVTWTMKLVMNALSTYVTISPATATFCTNLWFWGFWCHHYWYFYESMNIVLSHLVNSGLEAPRFIGTK